MGKDIKAKPGQGQEQGLDQELIRELAQLLTETGLTEIEIDREGMRVRVARQLTAGPAVPAAVPATVSAADTAQLAPALSLIHI